MPITDVDYPSRDGVIDAKLVRPEGEGGWPAIIMFSDIWGTRAVYEKMAARLSGEGYVVLLPNVYYREPPEEQLHQRGDHAIPADRERAANAMRTLTPDRVRADGRAALDFLAAQPCVGGSRTGIVGYCMSGSFAVWIAADQPDRVAAAASFHGGNLVTDQPDSPHRLATLARAELYFGHGDADTTMTAEQIKTLEQTLGDAGARFTSELYTGARHGFAIEDGIANYDEAAAERHWRAMLDLFARTLKG